jgi:myosin heavy subunit
LRELETARAEIERLALTVQREQAASNAAASHNEELLAAHGGLNLRIQELEAYIDGRASSWSLVQAEIAEHKSTILRLEKSLKSQERAVEEVERQKRSLASTLGELKQENANLTAQSKEREAAYQNLEHRLGDVRAAHAWLQADVARHRAEHQGLMAKTKEDRELIASLEAELASRAQTLSLAEHELAAARAMVEELTSTKDALATLLEQQTDLASALTAELQNKQAGLDVLDRSVRRISDLGASVAELERRFEFGSSESDAARAEALASVANERHEIEDLLPAETFLGTDHEGDTTPLIARRTSSGARKLIGMIGGEEVDYLLGKSEMTIGRGKTSDIRIQSHYISRLHARISTRGIATTIEDVGSKNGILANRERVTRAVLRDGDVVTLASELELQFVDARH